MHAADLAEHLDVPLRDRNALLLAGGYAPAYPERGLAEPELTAVRAALRKVLAGHEPYPAVVVNRWWELVDAKLLQPPACTKSSAAIPVARLRVRDRPTSWCRSGTNRRRGTLRREDRGRPAR